MNAHRDSAVRLFALRAAAFACAATIAFAAAPVHASERVVRAAGPDAQHLDVIAWSFGTGAPAQVGATLANVRFLDVAAAGRSALDAFDLSRGATADLAPGVRGVRLPGPARETVLRYRRGASAFGFLRIGANGATVLFERSGTGAGQATDPFDPVIAVDPLGRAIAVTSFEHDQDALNVGDTWLVPLSPPGPAVELTGPGVQEVEGASLLFAGDALFAFEEDVLVRAPVDGSAGFAPVPGVPAAAEFSEELAVSADGATIAFLAGADEQHLDLFVLGADGVVRNVTNAPAEIEPPGYLPETTTGPHLALSPDGALAAFDVEIANGHELFLVATGIAAPAPAHVTTDVAFEVSIDNISGIFFDASRVRFFADSGLANADLYQAGLAAGSALEVDNLTRTSGAAAPFFPNLATIDVLAAWRVGGARLVVDDRANEGKGFDLWRIDAAGNAAVALASLSAPPRLAEGGTPAAPRFVLLAAHAAGTDLHVAGGPAGISPAIARVPAAFAVTEAALDFDARFLAVIAQPPAGPRLVALVDRAGQLPPLVGALAGAEGLRFTPEGRLLVSGANGSPLEETWVVEPLLARAFLAGAPQAEAFWLR